MSENTDRARSAARDAQVFMADSTPRTDTAIVALTEAVLDLVRECEALQRLIDARTGDRV